MNIDFHSVVATMNTTARSENVWSGLGTIFEAQMDMISDDAAGIVFLEFKNDQGQNLGSALLVG
jgi:hypothetical protein